MDSIVGVIGAPAGGNFKFNNDDDGSDKLSHRYTVAILIVCAVVVSSKQYVGEPINCWVPAHFTGSHESYANSYCWIKNTYFLPFDEQITGEANHPSKVYIPYYQWVPLILLFMALLFYLPRMLWRTLNSRVGVDIDNVVEAAEIFQNDDGDKEKKEKVIRYMFQSMDRFLTASKHDGAVCNLSLTYMLGRLGVCGQRSGNYLTRTYLVIKILFIANVIAQLFMLDSLLGQSYHTYGFDLISDLIAGRDWRDSPRFPRVTMCDFKVRRLGNVQTYTVQCVLPINLFNEMIFLVLWFWFVLVALVSIYTFFRWAMRSLSSNQRYIFIRKHLDYLDRLYDVEEDEKRRPNKRSATGRPLMGRGADADQFSKLRGQSLSRFVNQYLRSDGVFILRLVGVNTDAVTVTEFVCALWDNFLEKEVGNDSRAVSQAGSSEV